MQTLMIRAVLDTNTIISALFWDGKPLQVYLAAADRHQAITSHVQSGAKRTILCQATTIC
jgi:predicted nucleic acid-binding protein